MKIDTLKYDVKSGFVIFLIALPLSIGIALASGAPPAAGLIAAAIGGILGSLLGAGSVTINGPAAGLIVIVLGAVESLGHGNQALGFKYTLAAIVAVGLLQICVGALKLASVGLAFPSSVVHGLLSAIGAIIISKQLHSLIGVKPNAKSVVGLLMEFPQDLAHLNPEIAYIGFASALLLLFWSKNTNPKLKQIPAPLLVVGMGVALGRYFDLEHEHIVRFFTGDTFVDRRFLLNVPNNIRDSLTFPDFSAFFTKESFFAIFSIGIIASIESTLSTFAVDKLDREKRTTDLNRDMVSKGICNTLCGLIGGLPIISEIVRSSANIDNGAKSRASNFIHGLLILLFMILVPSALHAIPLACLAAILIFVGWRLAHPSQFAHAYHIGADHIAAFAITFAMTLATDLLIGVASGVVVEFVIALLHGVKPSELFSLKITESVSTNSRGTVNVSVQSPAIFSNSLTLRGVLNKILAAKQNVNVNLDQSLFIDHTVLDQLSRFESDFAAQGLVLKSNFSVSHISISQHPLASRRKAS